MTCRLSVADFARLRCDRPWTGRTDTVPTRESPQRQRWRYVGRPTNPNDRSGLVSTSDGGFCPANSAAASGFGSGLLLCVTTSVMCQLANRLSRASVPFRFPRPAAARWERGAPRRPMWRSSHRAGAPQAAAMVPLPAGGRSAVRRTRARLPATPVGLGQGLRHRGMVRADPRGLYPTRRAAGGGGSMASIAAWLMRPISIPSFYYPTLDSGNRQDRSVNARRAWRDEEGNRFGEPLRLYSVA